MSRTRLGRNGSPETEDRTPAASLLARAIADAATRTSIIVAERIRRPTEDVRQQLDEVAHWMTAQLAPHDAPAPSPVPLPIIAREYVDMLRTALIAQLEAAPVLDGREVVRALGTLEELTRAWKKTDRGRFISRLTGAESADAVIAIAHDIRSPLT